jgi:hypothetical protein
MEIRRPKRGRLSVCINFLLTFTSIHSLFHFHLFPIGFNTSPLAAGRSSGLAPGFNTIYCVPGKTYNFRQQSLSVPCAGNNDIFW